MKGLRESDGYYSNRRVVQSDIWLSISLIIQRNHKRFKWNLVGWLETCEERLSGTCFTFDFHVCQKLIIICPVIFQKTESPQLALGGTEIGSGNHGASPGLLERENEHANSVANGNGPLMAVLGFLPCFQDVPTCRPVPTSSGIRRKENASSLASSWTSFLPRDGTDPGFGTTKSQSGDQTTIYYEEFT